MPVTGQFAPSRQVVLDGAVDVRDIGGYRSRFGAGATVRRDLLFRGDAPCQLSAADVQRLAMLRLRTVIDLRTPAEVLLDGADRLPPGLDPVQIPVPGGDLAWLYQLVASGDYTRQREALGEGRAEERMRQMYRGFVADPRQRRAFAAALELLCRPGRLPALFHCTAGKDRTGWLAAILLTALGVPRDQVLADYMASNDYYWPAARRWLAQRADPELLRPLMTQRPGYLEAAFEEAAARYGSFPAFLDAGLGLGPGALARLREGLLS